MLCKENGFGNSDSTRPLVVIKTGLSRWTNRTNPVIAGSQHSLFPGKYHEGWCQVNEKESKDEAVHDWQVVEAVLFSSNHSLTIPQIKKITGFVESGKIAAIISDLNVFYRFHNRPYAIQKVAGGYQLRSLAKFNKWIRKGRIVKPIQLSASVMETLAIVTYRQPITRAEVEEIRSVDATYALRSLLDKKLIKIAGRKDIPGRPMLYKTSSFFLEVFGFNSLQELPRPEEFDILPEQETETELDQTEDI